MINVLIVIISEELWEPGKSNAKLLKVSNNGNLAAKVKLNFSITDGGLAEALWFDFVQVKDGQVQGQFTKRPMKSIGDLAKNHEVKLQANENVQYVLVYGMKEEADNTYQGKNFSLDVTINATQLNSEEDGFGNPDYDKIDEWDGTADTSWYDASASTYSLTDAEDLAGFKDLVKNNTFSGKTIELKANVDLNGQEWTSSGNFSGTFDGNNKEIKGIKGTKGLFNNVKNGTVKDLKISDAKVEKNNSATGILCDRIYGTTTIQNVSVSGTVNNNNFYTGGMVGAIINTSNVTFKDCVSNVNVTSNSQHTGGMVGIAYAGVTFENCKNYGNVTNNGSYDTGTGGILGYATGYASTSPKAPTFVNCENKGTINGQRAGGIAESVGIEGGMTNCKLTVTFKGCKNSGSVTGSVYSGDICGGRFNVTGASEDLHTIVIE